MKKAVKILSVFLCVILILIPFSITASADATYDLIQILLQLYQNWQGSVQDDINDMSGDEFYQWFNSYSDLNSAAWRSIFNQLMSPNTLGEGSVVGQSGKYVSGLTSYIDDMNGAMYNRAVLNRSILESLNDEAVDFASKNGHRSYSLDELHLSTNDPTNSSALNYSGSPITHMPSSFFLTFGNECKGFYSFSSGEVQRNYISIYSGGLAAPALYVPKGMTLFQDGIPLPNDTDYFYIILGDNLLLRVTQHSNVVYAPYYFSSSSDVQSVTFGIMGGFFSESTETGIAGRVRDEACNLYRSGCIIGTINTAPYDGWSMVDLFEKMPGFTLEVADNIKAPDSFIPDDIPYDDNGLVVVMVPQGGGDIIYMSPTDYNNHVNNGTIVEGDYNQSFSDETINNIINNYNNYSNYGYDDTNLLNKLENWFDDVNNNLKKIIDRLDTIIDTIDNFNSQPIYSNFSDCMFNNVPALDQLKKSVEDSLSSEDTQSLVFSFDFTAFGIKDFEFNIDFSWYEPYRLRIRDILKLGAYIVGIGAWWRGLRSIFGIHGIGGD